MKKTISRNKLKLIDLKNTKSYVFHGSVAKIESLKPRQGFCHWKPDGPPAVFATEIVDIAIFRSLINKHRWDIVGPSESNFWIKDEVTYFSLTQNLL